MAIGPVQLIVLGFDHPDFQGEIIEELERLRESDTVKVIDALAVYKDADGEIEVAHLSNLTRDEAIELGSQGRRPDRPRHRGRGGHGGRRERRRRGGAGRHRRLLRRGRLGRASRTSRTTRPRRCILIEHHWAVPLRDAIVRADGFRLADGFISPLDLVAIGLLTAEEAEEHAALEQSRRRPRRTSTRSEG